MDALQRLRLTEIFYSLQGETSTVGIPTTFIRLTGCPLRCQYCDTAYAFSGGQFFSIEDVLQKVATYPTSYVTVTGGEPLAQKACIALLQALCDKNYRVSLETSGAMDVSLVDPRVVKILDLKTPGSQESHRNLYTNIDYLNAHDEVKFVICTRADYDWCVQKIKEYNLLSRCTVLFSPSFKELSLTDLANWILEDRLQVRLQMQLHKLLWNDTPGK